MQFRPSLGKLPFDPLASTVNVFLWENIEDFPQFINFDDAPSFTFKGRNSPNASSCLVANNFSLTWQIYRIFNNFIGLEFPVRGVLVENAYLL